VVVTSEVEEEVLVLMVLVVAVVQVTSTLVFFHSLLKTFPVLAIPVYLAPLLLPL